MRINNNMKVLLSDSVGFCCGVRRTLQLVHNAIKTASGNVFTDGELVHNKSITQSLCNQGIRILSDDDLKTIQPEDCIITRAHGLPQDRQRYLYYQNCKIVDGTCPHVRQIIKTIESASQNEDTIIIVGNEQHPEVIALMSAANNSSCHVISSLDDISLLPKIHGNILFVAQSTIDEKHFNILADAIRQKFQNITIYNSICQSSKKRQSAIDDLIKQGAQAIVIVGGKHSNNTCVLVTKVIEHGIPAFHVESDIDIDISAISKFHTLGVMSGASTHDDDIKKVVNVLENIP